MDACYCRVPAGLKKITMKKLLINLCLLFSCTIVKAQLYVQSNAILHVGGEITLHNQDFIRGSGGGPNIEFEPASKVLFTGNADNIISGYINFLNLDREGRYTQDEPGKLQ